MVEAFHIAAQYLTTVAISFLDKKDDDSHTNLGWKEGALHTRSLSEDNCIFSLDYESFTLIWSNDVGYKNSLELDGKNTFGDCALDSPNIFKSETQTSLRIQFTL